MNDAPSKVSVAIHQTIPRLQIVCDFYINLYKTYNIFYNKNNNTNQ